MDHWKSDSLNAAMHTVAVSSAIQRSEFMADEQCVRLVQGLVDALNSIPE
jgi:hypothetical protein